MSDNTIVFHEPVRPGDRLTTRQILRSVSDEKTTKLGTGRFWVIDVEYRNQRGELVAVESYTGFGYRRPAPPTGRGPVVSVTPVTRLLHGDVAVGDELPELAYPVTATTVVLGALAARDWRPMHHDKDFAVNRNGTRDIFLNTPNQAAWFERFVTDWTGPYGRLQRMTFRMLGSIFPGDTMVFRGRGHRHRGRRDRVRLGGHRHRRVGRRRRQDDLSGPGGPAGRPRTTTRGPARATGGGRDRSRRVPDRSHASPARGELTMLDLEIQRRTGDAPRDGARGVRHHQPAQRGPRARGRPDRLLARAVEAAGPPRPASASSSPRSTAARA